MVKKIADLVVALDDAPNLDLAIERAMRSDTCDVDPEDCGRYLVLESVRVNLYRFTDKTPVILYRFGLYDGDPEPLKLPGFNVPMKEIT